MMEYRVLDEKDVLKMAQFVDDQCTVYQPEQMIAFLRQKNAFGFVAVENERIAGFAFGYRLVKPDGRSVFYLHALDVMKEYQGKGYGTALVRFICEYGKKIGCSKMFLLTDDENKAACACYEKAGGIHREALLYEFKDKENAL